MQEKKIIKLIRAVDLLARPEGTTINELSAELAVNRRGVYRILENLQAMQFPVYEEKTDEERAKRWRLQEDYVKRLPNISVPELKLSFAEILALFLLKGQAALYSGTRLEEEARSAFDKIGAYLPSALYRQLDGIKTLFVPQSKFAKDYAGKEEIIDTLAESMLTRKRCRIQYFAFKNEQSKQYRIDPLHFFESGGGMYIFVRIPRHGTIRTLAVERIDSIEKTDEAFEYPDDFDPEQILSSAFDMVYDDPVSLRVWISSAQAKYVRERKFFRDQTLSQCNDGSVIIDIRTSGWGDVKRWILSLGADAEVLSPERLRQEMKAEIRKLSLRYGRGLPSPQAVSESPE